MNPEPFTFAETLARRKESARRTIRDISINEVPTLVGQLFPDGTHPFIEQNVPIGTPVVIRQEAPREFGPSPLIAYRFAPLTSITER
jgi:hypothetical protein